MTLHRLVAVFSCLGLSLAAASATRAQAPVWKGSVQGTMTVTGNTLGLDADAAGAAFPGDMDGIGTFIADPFTFASSQDPGYPAGTTPAWTKNGSTALLDVPANAPIVRAQLVWACSTQAGVNVPDAALGAASTVTLRLPNGTTHVVAPDGEVTDLTLVSASYTYYQRWADVTTLVTQGGPGAYTVSKVYGVAGTDSSYVTGCGWTLFTVYQDETEPVRAFGLWMTAKKVCYTGTGCPQNSEVTLTGFCTPEAPAPVAGRLFASALEGDARWTGDSLALKSPTTSLFIPLSGPNNAATNFFASQINDPFGALDVAGTFGQSNDKVNPLTGVKDIITPVLRARQGWDITAVPLNHAIYSPGVLSNGQSNVTARFTTAAAPGGGDDYIVSAVGMEIDLKAPSIVLAHSADTQATWIGDRVVYTVTLTNNGFTTADALFLCYADPPNATFTGNLTLNGAAVSGVSQATLAPAGCVNGTGGVAVGALGVGSTKTVTLEYVVDDIAALPGPGHTVITTPSWRSTWNDPCAGAAQALSGSGQAVEIPGARLAVVLSASPGTPPNLLTGDTITYTAAISDVGAADTPPTSTFSIPVPAGTAYVAGSTTFNNAALADQAGGAPPFATLREIHSPGAAAGVVRLGQPVIITFQVKVIATTPMFVTNQGKADIDGAGPAPERFSNQTSTAVGGADVDNDGVVDVEDNCPLVYNPDQANHYDVFGYSSVAGDAEGDVCDDTDGDGLLDSEEDLSGNGWDAGAETSATDPDTDGDGLCDGAITIAPCFGHEDQDGDKSHLDWGNTETSPILSDSDGDGLCDGRQVTATDCRGSEDVDGDADWHDYDEVTDTETNPLNPDTDGGGVSDGAERDAGTNPLDPCEGDLIDCGGPDQDFDHVIDPVDNCPTVYNPDQSDNYPPGGNGIGDVCDDVDQDGILDRAEDLGPDGVPGTGDETNPMDPDSDGDGLCDGAITVPPCVGPEDRDGDRDPADWGTTETSPVDSDSDDDGLCDGFRRTAIDCSGGEDKDGDFDPTDYDEPTDSETNPLDPDTDHGGALDGVERTNGTNPLDPCDDFGQWCGPVWVEGGACQGGGGGSAVPVALLLALGALVLRRKIKRA
ncbi:MAG: hypothetical protein CVU56_23850 [Deltaproteobacteria bacterium HGW-Deltaproteobacteria-14]|jgi:uncharacterized repeat protein (TIGR01451 family)|nr:MAG: hypothetical protein CVU56_23850 [Deltaproteobacteria bacterium HGW-Deltaproteobacteria-14]